MIILIIASYLAIFGVMGVLYYWIRHSEDAPR